MTTKFSSTSFTPVEIFASHYPVMTAPVVIASGQVLPEGAVLGKITASGKLVLSTAAASDGFRSRSRSWLTPWTLPAATRT